MSAPAATSHRERLLREGVRQLYARGFHGATVDNILDASGVPKGSFYHHFGSKEAFTREVLRRYMERQLERIERWARDDELSTPKALAGYFGEMADGFVRSEYQRACLAGKLCAEVAADYDAFRAQLAGDMAGWKGRIVEMLGRGQACGDVRVDRSATELADAVLALIQGAFVVALASREASSLDSVRVALELLTAAPA